MSTTASTQRRIACVQFDSKHADVSHNIVTVLNLVTEQVLDKRTPINLLVLPELALTGYLFKTKEEIHPLLEDAHSFTCPDPISPSFAPTGNLNHIESMSSFLPTFIRACRSSCASSQQPSLTLAFHLAQQLSSHVVIGFPERAPNIPALRSSRGNASPSSPFDARPHEARSAKTSTMPSEHSAYNSAALFAPDRSLLHIFRKHFLFESDEVWADQGSGFEVLHTPSLGNICVAICMDLNPFRFRTPFEKYELASFCAQKDVDLLVMPMAWLLPKDEKEKIIDKDKAETEHKPSLGTINYWAMRCMPLFNPQGTPSHAATTISSNHPSHGGAPKTTYFIATNRAGTERSSTFAGSSCVLQMKMAERPVLLGSLGSAQEGCLVVTLPS